MQQQRQSAGVTGAYVIVTCLFFAWGFITSLVDPLVAAVKGIFHLSDVEAQLSASAFFIAYGVMSLPGRGSPGPHEVRAIGVDFPDDDGLRLPDHAACCEPRDL